MIQLIIYQNKTVEYGPAIHPLKQTIENDPADHLPEQNSRIWSSYSSTKTKQ
jgi:hypothetical protein